MRDRRFFESHMYEVHNQPTPERAEQLRAETQRLIHSPADVPALMQHLSDVHGAYWAELEAFEALAEAEPGQRQEWVDALANTALAGVNQGLDERESEALDATIQDWATQHDPLAALIPSHGLELLETEPYEQIALVLGLDARRGLELLEWLPCPQLARKALHTRGEDRALLSSLLEQAPPVFDPNGAWSSGRHVAAVLVCEMLEDHANRLMSDDPLCQAQPSVSKTSPEPARIHQD